MTLLALCTVSMSAQQMAINNFSQMRKGLLRTKTFATDKTQATLELHTSEKGFTFTANGKDGVTAVEDDDKITLLLPHRTRYITIRHDDYGSLIWKVPRKVKVLKKKRRYQCDLMTLSPKKEYRMTKQWVVFHIQPDNAILYVDSTQTFVRGGEAQLYMPLGEHQCRVEAPFYEPWTGTVSLTEDGRTEQHVTLQSIYSYLTVRTPLDGAAILLDGTPIGIKEAMTDRLAPGRYRLAVVRNNVCFYNSVIDIAPTERKVLDITEKMLSPVAIPTTMTPQQWAANDANDVMSPSADSIKATVHIIAPDSETAILINRDVVGEGEWQGQLPQGLYAVHARKDSLETATCWLRIDDSTEQVINLATPQSAYGMLNIESNVVGADIYINGKHYGTTPAVIRDLPAGHNYRVRLTKEGYRDVEKLLLLRGNEMNRLAIDMKTK